MSIGHPQIYLENCISTVGCKQINFCSFKNNELNHKLEKLV